MSSEESKDYTRQEYRDRCLDLQKRGRLAATVVDALHLVPERESADLSISNVPEQVEIIGGGVEYHNKSYAGALLLTQKDNSSLDEFKHVFADLSRPNPQKPVGFAHWIGHLDPDNFKKETRLVGDQYITSRFIKQEKELFDVCFSLLPKADQGAMLLFGSGKKPFNNEHDQSQFGFLADVSSSKETGAHGDIVRMASTRDLYTRVEKYVGKQGIEKRDISTAHSDRQDRLNGKKDFEDDYLLSLDEIQSAKHSNSRRELIVKVRPQYVVGILMKKMPPSSTTEDLNECYLKAAALQQFVKRESGFDFPVMEYNERTNGLNEFEITPEKTVQVLAQYGLRHKNISDGFYEMFGLNPVQIASAKGAVGQMAAILEEHKENDAALHAATQSEQERQRQSLEKQLRERKFRGAKKVDSGILPGTVMADTSRKQLFIMPEARTNYPKEVQKKNFAGRDWQLEIRDDGGLELITEDFPSGHMRKQLVDRLRKVTGVDEVAITDKDSVGFGCISKSSVSIVAPNKESLIAFQEKFQQTVMSERGRTSS